MAKLALLAAAALTLSMGEADALSPVVRVACMSDYAAYCNGLKVGTAALRSCMKSHRHMLSQTCIIAWALRAKSPMRRSDNTSATCTKSNTRSAAAKGLAQVRSRLRRYQTNRAKTVSAIQINDSVVSTLKVRSTDPFRLDSLTSPPKHHWVVSAITQLESARHV